MSSLKKHHAKAVNHLPSEDSDDQDETHSDSLHSSSRKRKNSERSSASPRKRKTLGFTEDSDEAEDDDEDEMKDTGKVALVAPSDALFHLQKIKEIGGKQHNAKAALDAYVAELEYKGDKTALRKSLQRYLLLSMHPKAITMEQASAMMTDYLEGITCLKFFPEYPKKPSAAIFHYMIGKGISPGPQSIKAASEKMKKDEKGRAKAEKDTEAGKEMYITKMNAFVSKYQDILSQKQRKYCEDAIRRHDKALHPEKFPPKEPKKERGSGKKKKEHKTPFDFFLSVSTDKYLDLDPEKRIRKLGKKFEKLDAGVKEVYEKLALRENA